MAFADEMLPPLHRLAAKLLENKMYLDLSSAADILAAFKSGNWSRLSDEDQAHYLEKMVVTFHPRGMGDSVIGGDPDYSFIVSRIDQELRGVRKRLSL